MSRRSSIVVKKSVYQMSMMTLIASFVWVSMSIYQALQEPVDEDVKLEMLQSLSPVIDGETLDNLMVRRQMGGADWTSLSTTMSVVEEAIEVEEVVESTESAIVQP